MSDHCPFDDVPEPTRVMAKPDTESISKWQVLAVFAFLVALVIGVGVILATNGCAAIEKADAVPSAWYTPAPGYPCGPKAEVCTLKAGGTCGSFCNEGDLCPGKGCMAGECCPGGSFDQGPSYGAMRDPDAGSTGGLLAYPVHVAP